MVTTHTLVDGTVPSQDMPLAQIGLQAEADASNIRGLPSSQADTSSCPLIINNSDKPAITASATQPDAVGLSNCPCAPVDFNSVNRPQLLQLSSYAAAIQAFAAPLGPRGE